MTRQRLLSNAVLVAVLAAGPVFAQNPPASPPPASAPAAEAPASEEPAAEAPAAEAPAEAPAAAADERPPALGSSDAPPLAAPPPAPEIPGAEEAAQAQGSLSVSSTPSGKVFVDGNDTGLTTPVVDLPVAPGKHVLTIVGEDGREQSTDFDIEAGGSLNLNVNLPEPEPAAEPAEEPAPSEEPVITPEPAATADAPAPWTWMTVAGWTGLGLGTIGLLSGSVVLTQPDPDARSALGYGLFGAGAGLVLGGGVLLYLDSELAESSAAPPEG